MLVLLDAYFTIFNTLGRKYKIKKLFQHILLHLLCHSFKKGRNQYFEKLKELFHIAGELKLVLRDQTLTVSLTYFYTIWKCLSLILWKGKIHFFWVNTRISLPLITWEKSHYRFKGKTFTGKKSFFSSSINIVTLRYGLLLFMIPSMSF